MFCKRLLLCAGVGLCVASVSRADTLFSDTFDNGIAYNVGSASTYQTLPNTPYIGYYNLPQNSTTGSTIYSQLSSSSPAAGFETIQGFGGLGSATLSMEVSPVQGYDSILQLGLAGDDGSVSLGLFAGDSGGSRFANVDGTITTSPLSWQTYGEYLYQLTLGSDTTQMTITDLYNNDATVFSTEVNEGLDQIGPNAHITIEQSVDSTFSSSYQNGADIQNLDFEATPAVAGTPLPKSAVGGMALLGCVALSAIRRRSAFAQ